MGMKEVVWTIQWKHSGYQTDLSPQKRKRDLELEVEGGSSLHNEGSSSLHDCESFAKCRTWQCHQCFRYTICFLSPIKISEGRGFKFTFTFNQCGCGGPNRLSNQPLSPVTLQSWLFLLPQLAMSRSIFGECIFLRLPYLMYIAAVTGSKSSHNLRSVKPLNRYTSFIEVLICWPTLYVFFSDRM